MITVSVNGEKRALENPLTLKKLLENFAIPSQAIAVAVNQEVVPRSEFDRREIQDQDRVEVIRAVGGG